MKNSNYISEKSFKSESDRTKKTEKANLENKKGIFFEIGLILSLTLVLFAFEWKSYDTFKPFITSGNNNTDIIELPPITKPIPPEPKILKPTTIFKLVENTDKDVKDILIDVEVKPDEPNVGYIPIETKPEIEVIENQIFIGAEEMPDFIGGDEARVEYLRKNIVYPSTARETGIQGTVYLTFVIEKNGEITDVKILRGVGGGCDEEATRVVKAMPKWKPGKQRDKAVRVQFNLPIKFQLAN